MSDTTTASAETEVRPFRIDVPEREIEELRRRIDATRWPTKELVADRSQGVQLAAMQELARYWTTEYDWRRCEARLNALPQFKTEIDGLNIHFIHVKSRHENALPLIMTHGWPGSIDRAARDHRPPHRPDRARRTRRGRVPPRAAVDPRLRLLRRADRARLGPHPHRPGLARAHAAPRLHPVRRAGRRRGLPGHRRDGPPVTRRFARHPHEPAHAGAGRRRRPERVATHQRRTCCPRPARRIPRDRHRLLRGAGNAPGDDRLRPSGFTHRPGGLDDRSRHRRLREDRPRLCRQSNPRAISPGNTSSTTSRCIG